VLAHSHDLRRGRCSIRGQPYHLRFSIRDRKPLLRELVPARVLVRTLREMDTAGCTRTLAFMVMPDHVHWLCVLRARTRLDPVVHWVKGTSARRIHLALGRSGPLWQSGYFDRAIRSDRELLPTARYIVANPLRAGLVEHIGDWPFWDVAWELD
jgi:REP element-mobilizing transposase RayT